jgi:hypothetical protein
MLKKGEVDMNIYDFIKMHLHTIEYAKRKRHERREIRKLVMENKRRMTRDKAADNHIDFYYFEKGKLKEIKKC